VDVAGLRIAGLGGMELDANAHVDATARRRSERHRGA
jgi:hypothetical protein